MLLFRIRCWGRRNFPESGGVIVCSNHQSNLDPVLVGLTTDRRLNYMASKTLFDNQIFGRWIRFWDAIPIDRTGMGFSGIKECLKRLKRGEMLLLFPEGTRSRDGQVGRLKAGFCTLARRAKVPILPIGFDGAYDSWPRTRTLPWLAKIHVCIGQPLSAELIASLTDEELIEELERRIRHLFEEARCTRLSERGVPPSEMSNEVA